jgi:hypothetical protein
MEKQHTPGPWTAQPFTGKNNAYAWEVIGALGLVPQVCRLALVDQGPAVVEANARLIAAAPAMLAVLEAVAKEYDNDVWNGVAEVISADTIADIKAAIRQAKGEA